MANTRRDLIVIGSIVGVLALVVYGWLFSGSKNAKTEAVSDSNPRRELDSLAELRKAEEAAHEQRMKSDKKYRDSVRKAERAQAAEDAAVEAAGIGVSSYQAKDGLESLDWETTSTGEGAKVGSMVFAINGPSRNLTGAGAVMKVSGDVAAAQGTLLRKFIQNFTGESAAKTIIDDFAAKTSGRKAGTTGAWEVGRMKVSFAFDRSDATVAFVIARN